MISVLEQNMKKIVYPGKSQFYYIKVGCKGVYITRTCYHDARDLQLSRSMLYLSSPCFLFFMVLCELFVLP